MRAIFLKEKEGERSGEEKALEPAYCGADASFRASRPSLPHRGDGRGKRAGKAFEGLFGLDGAGGDRGRLAGQRGQMHADGRVETGSH